MNSNLILFYWRSSSQPTFSCPYSNSNLSLTIRLTLMTCDRSNPTHPVAVAWRHYNQRLAQRLFDKWFEYVRERGYIIRYGIQLDKRFLNLSMFIFHNRTYKHVIYVYVRLY